MTTSERDAVLGLDVLDRFGHIIACGRHIGGSNTPQNETSTWDMSCQYCVERKRLIQRVLRESRLPELLKAIDALQLRLDEHFGNHDGHSDWKEEAALRAAKAAFRKGAGK